MIRRTLCTALLAAAATAGCANLTDADGRRVSLGQYDSVIVDEVKMPAEIPYPEMTGCLRAALELELLASRRWLPPREVEVRTLRSAAGRDDPYDPASTHSDARRLREQDKWNRRLKKPTGRRPVLLRAEFTKVHFPSWSSMTVLGSTCYAYCRISLYDPASVEPLGTARAFAAPEFPRLGVWNAAIVGVLSNVIRYKNYTQEDRLVLARDMARQIVRILDRAGGSRAPQATPKAPPADPAEAG